jgi:hypothetical protein
MTRPRIVDPGVTLALSRRTTRRHFLLHPDEARQMEQVYWYCLAYAANLHGVLTHAACLMSTHCHEVITDVRGEYARFLQTLHRNLALCTKAFRGWPGVHTLPGHVGTRVVRVKRPKHYFNPENSEWPEELELRVEMPVALELGYGAEFARERIAERVRDKQHQAWNQAKRSGLSFIGPRRVLKLAHTKRAKSYEVFGSLNPQFAVGGESRGSCHHQPRS